MPRTRSIRPGFFTNDALCKLPPLTRLLFAGLWTVADRDGRLLDRPAKLKAELFPYDHISVERGLQQLHAAGFIQRYSSDGSVCVQIMSWYKHQKPHPREEASLLPPPVGWTELEKPDLGAPPAPARSDPEPDLGAPPARLVASSSSSSRSFNSLRERPPNPPADARGRPRRRRRNGALVFDEDRPQYEQRVGADGKREWVPVDA